MSRLKNYTAEMKANAMSSTYLMGQGKKDWDGSDVTKTQLIVIDPFERAAWLSQNLKKFFQSDGVLSEPMSRL